MPLVYARPGAPLTPREREVFATYCTPGVACRKHTAELLGITPDTVRNHIASVLIKLDAINVLDAALSHPELVPHLRSAA
jgi:DNA-binding CsgD family transcriptional regulator